MKQREGTLRVALAFAALMGSLTTVIWRQSGALEVLRDLDAAKRERAAVESERSRLSGRIQQLESRARIMTVTQANWGMRVPSSGEEFVLLLPQSAAEGESPRVQLRFARAGIFGGVAELLGEGH